MKRILFGLTLAFSFLLTDGAFAESKEQLKLNADLYHALLARDAKEVTRALEAGADLYGKKYSSDPSSYGTYNFFYLLNKYNVGTPRVIHAILSFVEKDASRRKKFIGTLTGKADAYVDERTWMDVLHYGLVLDDRDFRLYERSYRNTDDPLYLKEHNEYLDRAKKKREQNVVNQRNMIALLHHFIKHETVAGFKPASLDKPAAKTLPRNSGKRSLKGTHKKN